MDGKEKIQFEPEGKSEKIDFEPIDFEPLEENTSESTDAKKKYINATYTIEMEFGWFFIRIGDWCFGIYRRT